MSVPAQKPPVPQTYDEALAYIRYLLANGWKVPTYTWAERRSIRLAGPAGSYCCPVTAICLDATGDYRPVNAWKESAAYAGIPCGVAKKLASAADRMSQTGYRQLATACGLTP